MAAIRHYLVIRGAPDQVYEAIATQEGLAGWWTRDTVADVHVGGEIEFRFGTRYYNKMRVTALEPDTRVTWECLEGDPEWIGTTFDFRVEPRDDGTSVLRFVHDLWEKEEDFFASCNYHWGYYLRSIKLLVETGEGTPYKE